MQKVGVKADKLHAKKQVLEKGGPTVSLQSRINSKGIFLDELVILEKVNKEKAVFFKELSGEYQKRRLSHIARSLAVKGLVDLCVTKRKAGKISYARGREEKMQISCQ